MPNAREFPIALRILLPMLAAGALMLAPRATSLDAAFQGVRLAAEMNQSGVVAVRQMELAQWEPWRFELWGQAGRLALRGGEVDLAIHSLERAQQMGSLDDAGRLALGEAYWLRLKPAAALSTWDVLLQAGQAPQETYRRVVQYQRSLEEWEAATRMAQIWSRAYPQSSQAVQVFGRLGLALDWEAARAALQLAGSLEPVQTSASQVLLKTVMQLEPLAPKEYRAVQAGRALSSIGEWKLALVAFERARTINPTYAEAWAFSGEAKQHLDQDAWPDLERGLVLAPKSAALQAMAGLYFRRKGDAQQALRYFMTAAELEPQRAIWQVEIGSSYADLHNTQKGLEYYRKAVEIEPQSPELWRLMAQYCLNQDLAVRESGLPAARQAASMAPNDPASADLMGQVMLALEDEFSAERFLQQSLTKNLEYPAAYLHLGQLYLRQGRMDWAEYSLARAAQLAGADAESALLAQRLLERYFREH